MSNRPRTTIPEDNSKGQERRVSGLLALLIILGGGGVLLGYMLWCFYHAAK